MSERERTLTLASAIGFMTVIAAVIGLGAGIVFAKMSSPQAQQSLGTPAALAAPTATPAEAPPAPAPAPQAAAPAPAPVVQHVAAPAPRPRENCDRYLYGTNRDGGRIATNAVVGGGVGAGLGAAAGAIAGGAAGKGAGIGALVGVAGGTLYGLDQENKRTAQQRAAYNACMDRNAR